MRKSFVALALLVGAMALLANLALAQEDQGLKLRAPHPVKELTRAARLGTNADSDTLWIGHVTTGGYGPFHVGGGTGPGIFNFPSESREGIWDWELIGNAPGDVDSMQGWMATTEVDPRTAGTISDDLRPWNAQDYGNRMCHEPRQGRTYGIVSAWHEDAGSGAPDAANAAATPPWAPLSGTRSAWCGLRSGDDVTYLDPITHNPINGEALQIVTWDGLHPTRKNFPGYANQWDQMLYRDVKTTTGNMTVSFKYRTYMSTGLDNTPQTTTGWFQYDPLYVAYPNFISSSAQGMTGPIDSFMVYVGEPADPTSVALSNGTTAPVYDLQRRWFSEVIKINAPFAEILSTFGQDTAFKSSPFTATLAVPAGGLARVVFRVKTNTAFSDETGAGSFTDYGWGAAIIDDVDITGPGVDGEVHSQFEGAEIDNTIEPAGNGVGEGYALAHWHATGKPPQMYAHPHPVFGGDIGGGNVYDALAYDDLCGRPDSRLRNCNVYNIVISTGNHDDFEAAGGPLGTAFKETRQSFLGPTIPLIVPGTGTNAAGLDAYHVNTTDDWVLWYDIGAFIFNAPYSGNVWGWGVQNFPNTQPNGSVVWGDICMPTYVLFNPDPLCLQDYELMKTDGLIETTNESGIPDSIRILMRREQRCITWGVTTGCSPTGGHYIDNVSFGFPPNAAEAKDKIAVDIWQWINDAFPANETTGLPGTAAFDTCGAHLMTGINNAQTRGSTLRFDIPGDSIFVVSSHPSGTPYRVDLVFRILPGPGNYVVAGNKASGLKKRPDQATAVVRGDDSFWGQYLAAPGDFSKGTFAGTTWDADVWCSARCDTAELNRFPVNGRTANWSALSKNRWINTYHESDPKFGTLGILKNKCFLIDTLGVLTSGNITCAGAPAWLSDPEIAARAGYDGNSQTKEFTKIIPDGLLTAGSHVEYFLRQQDVTPIDPNQFAMSPDTNLIFLQPNEGPSYDAHRWQQFGVLPDRWKDAAYGGVGAACMLAVDYNDRRGDERIFISVGDSIGLSSVAKYGAHNGWYCTGAYVSSDGSHNYTGDDVGAFGQYDAVGGMAPGKITIWKHGGNPGTAFDFYQVKAAESSNTGAGGIGARLSNRASMGLATGKFGRQAPTPEMLRTYYKMVFLMSGDLNASVLGPVVDRGSDDVAILEDFLSYGANYQTPRGLWVMGDGFVESETMSGGSHATLLTNYLAVSLRDPSYFALSGSEKFFPDLVSVVPGYNVKDHTCTDPAGRHVFSAQNGCLWTNDILNVNPAIPGAIVEQYYENLGANGPYIASVYAPSNVSHPYVTLVTGYDMTHLTSRYGITSTARQVYFMDVLACEFASVCSFTPAPSIDVPENTVQNVDFLDNVWGNPMRAGGSAVVSFSLARKDRVEIKVYDVAGRLVRSLADRTFEAGPQQVRWDGTNDQGQRVARGVYFTQVKFLGNRFTQARKVTVLK